jgi:hypothetical protein
VKQLALALALALTLLAPAAVEAAPPPNDRGSAAAALELNQPVAGNWGEAANDYALSGSTCFTGIGQTPTTASGPDLVYRFVAPSAGSYVFRVRKPVAFDAVVYTAPFLPSGSGPQVVSGCGVAANRNTDQAAEEPAPTALAAGQSVFVVVDAVGAATSANLPFTVLAERVGSETEANNTPGTADATACGVRGVISPTGDVDFWALGAHASGSRVFALADGAAGAGSTYELRVTTATDTLEFDSGGADYPFGNNSSVVGGTPLGTAPVFLRVSRAGAVNEPYRLYSVVQPPSLLRPEAEPNATLGQAGPTAGYTSGTLSSETDVDTYRFSAPARGLVLIGVDADPTRNASTFDPTLQLLDSSGNSLVFVNDADGASNTSSGAGSLTSLTPRSPAEAIVARVPAGGTYYVRVTKNTAGVSDYLLSVSSSCRAGATVSPIVVSPTALPQARQRRRYSRTVTATGGFGAHTFTISSGALPRGLTLAANGAITGTPSRAGRFPFTVRATDAEDSIGERAYTLVVLDRVRPVISRLRVTNRVFAPKRRPRAKIGEATSAAHSAAPRARSSAVRRGTRFRFRLSEEARVAITIQRRTTGKRRGGRCVRRTERLRNRRNCVRWVKRGRVIRFAGRAGANSRRFSGRFGRRALKAGRYRARAVATDMAGNRSRPKTVGFRIRRP